MEQSLSHFLVCFTFPDEINFPPLVLAFFFLSLQGVEFQGPRTADMKEKARMESQLKRLAHDEAILREEINFLSRKDGHLIEQLSLLTRNNQFLQPSSPQDLEAPDQIFPVLKP